jgi:hypothetical protein
MNGRDAPDLLTWLQDALNVAHDNDSPSRPYCVARAQKERSAVA